MDTQTEHPWVPGLETELRFPVVEWLGAYLKDVVIAEEIALHWGTPDLVAGSLIGEAVRSRVSAYPVTDWLQVAALAALDKPVATEVLSGMSRWTPTRYRREVLLPLQQASLIEELPSGAWRRCGSLPDPFPHLVAVELKLRDWQKAIWQATQSRAFAHEVYIAMPAARLTARAQATAEAAGVGLLWLSDNAVTDVTPCPVRQPLDPRVKRLVSETVWATFVGLRTSQPAGSRGGLARPLENVLPSSEVSV